MTYDRLRYELRFLGKTVFLTPILVIIGTVIVVALIHLRIERVAQSLVFILEMMLPMAAGIVVATIATHDRALELQLTMPRRYQRTAALRLLFILLWSALVSLLTSCILYVFRYWRVPVQIAQWSQPWQFLTWQLTWLSSTLWLVALGLVLSLLLRSRSASGALIGVLAITEIIFHIEINQDPLYRPFYLFPLTFSPDADYWLSNRLELLGAAIVLLILTGFLLRQPELLLMHVDGEE